MATAASLANLLQLEADINYYTQQQIFWSEKYKANAEKLSKQTKYEETWNKAYDNAKDASRTTDLKMGNNVFIAKNTEASDSQAEQWANYKESHYDAELKEELSSLDVEYDAMQTMYNTMLETLRAEKDGAKQLVSSNAQDPHTSTT